VFVVGDVMYDAILDSIPRAEGIAPSLLSRLEVESGKYLLATVHRASNTDDPANLANIIGALSDCGEPVVFPAHPRTARALQQAGITTGPNVRQISPVSYLEMLALEKHARKVLTDSGGVQKEAMWLAVPCITMRNETEWVETVELGWNTLTGTGPARILTAIHAPRLHSTPPDVYGDGHAAENIVNLMRNA
jgi:UDP-N-acetylglucosamine 2-epimerase